MARANPLNHLWAGRGNDDLPDRTANAAFTSSAQEIPEPVSLIAVLAGGLGTLSVLRKRR